jgi:hypothetical protein
MIQSSFMGIFEFLKKANYKHIAYYKKKAESFTQKNSASMLIYEMIQ